MTSKPRQTLSVNFINDLPRAFTFFHQNLWHFAGPYGEALRYFAHYHDFNFDVELFDDVPSIAELYADIYKGRFNVSTYSAAFSVNNSRNNSQSYPVEYMEKCVMVPLAPEIPKYLYIIWPYGRYIWLSIFIGAIYIAVLMRFVAIATGSQQTTRSIVRNIPHALNISLYTNNMGLKIMNAPVMVLLFYFLLYVYGFILAAYHAPYMTAYNMKPIFVPPIDTVQDILDSKLRIKIKNSDYYELQGNDAIDLTIVDHIMDHINGTEFQRLLAAFNRSFAYIVSLDQWDFMRKQQQSLKQPYFHLSQVCFSAALRVFPIQPNWIYAPTFNRFLMRTQDAGLWQYWVELAFFRALWIKKAILLRDEYTVEPLNVEFFTIAWGVLCMGFTLSFFVFLTEHAIWFNEIRKLNVIVV